MRTRVLAVTLAMFAALAVSACSAMTERALQEEQKNGAQFASWDHMGYTLFRATPEKTTKQDIEESRQQRWWGAPVKIGS